MRVLRAAHLGFCFGVRDALKVVAQVADPADVTIRGELVHNPLVLHQLDDRGFHREPETQRHSFPTTRQVMITAHGISDRERHRLLAAGKELIDTTCPLVTRVHRAAQQLAQEGRHVIVIGRPGHVEVQGIVEDLPNSTVLAGPHSLPDLPSRFLGIVCQSTTPPRLAAEVVAALRERFPEADLQVVDTICQPTRDRQQAVLDLLPQIDALVVVGGKNSNNTRELARLAEERGVRTLHIEHLAELDPRWFQGVETCGLTAGTSTLDNTVAEVEAVLRNLVPHPTPEASISPATVTRSPEECHPIGAA
ncbi:MAG: 4-hydroxy-3-methylbut-2-enyl diphosphate reductase [Planctomycetaceae bacterium]|jgi:4-hydroxy-3-methylbut-2-enyl diphosphate reductase